MATAQVPPAVGTSGQLIDVVVVNAGSTIFREVVAIGSAFTSSGLAVVTTSAGLMTNVTSGTVTSTAATNPWSSAPGFNLPVVVASSSLIQISGAVATTVATNPWSSAPSFNTPIVAASSGATQIVGLVNTVSASSGLVQITAQSSDAGSIFGYVSSSSANSNLITGLPAAYFGHSAFNTTGSLRFVHLYHTSSAPGIGTTANWLCSFMVPFSTAGGGGLNIVNPTPLSYSTKGLGFTITDGISSTSTGSIGNNDVSLTIYYKL